MEPNEQPNTPKPDTDTPSPQPPASDNAPAAPAAPEASNKPKAYGKRPVWQWVVIYIIVAIVLYGLAYLIFFHKGSSSSGY